MRMKLDKFAEDCLVIGVWLSIGVIATWMLSPLIAALVAELGGA